MMADQLRADALGTGARNGGKPNTPNLDKLGNEGIRFTNSCENMQPCSHAAMQPCSHAAMQPCSHAAMQPCSPHNMHMGHVQIMVATARSKRKCTACSPLNMHRAMLRWWLLVLISSANALHLTSCSAPHTLFSCPLLQRIQYVCMLMHTSSVPIHPHYMRPLHWLCVTLHLCIPCSRLEHPNVHAGASCDSDGTVAVEPRYAGVRKCCASLPV
jgi:hypothetical protein